MSEYPPSILQITNTLKKKRHCVDIETKVTLTTLNTFIHQVK